VRSEDRQRKHDELWQKEVVDGMARMLDVLHDISDGIQKLSAASPPAPPAPPTANEESQKRLLSVTDLAALLGVTPEVVRGLRASGNGPPVTKVGRRIFFQRKDIEVWFEKNREVPVENFQPWRGTYLPGRIGSTVPSSSKPAERKYCSGSNTEPMAASPYSGRAVCRVCKDHPIVNRDGRLRKHYPRGW
jgi:hypothetical protein